MLAQQIAPCLILLAALLSHGLRAYSMRSKQGLSGGGHAYERRWDGVLSTLPSLAKRKKQRRNSPASQVAGEAVLRCERVMRADGHHVFVEATFNAAVNEDEVRTSFEGGQTKTPPPICRALRRPLVVVGHIDPTLHLFADGEAFPSPPTLQPNSQREWPLSLVKSVPDGEHRSL